MLDLSCRDWEARLRDGRPLVPDLELPNPDAGAKAVAAFDRLRLADVPGTPTLHEAGAEWFRAIIRALFGSLDPVTRERLIRELFILVPKKNAKTTKGALLMLTALLLNERPRAPMALMGPVQDTAEDAFAAAAGAIALDDVLSKKLHVRDHLKKIIHRETKAELEIMTFDPEVLTGKKFVAVLVDELHVIAKNSKASKAIRQVRGGMLPFPEAFLAFITTQSEEAPSGVFAAELKQARAIRDGEARGAMLSVLYELPMKMQQDPAVWKDPKNWAMVTPNAGKSISIKRLIEEFETAKGKGEEELRGWASQHLNVQIGVALIAHGWTGAAQWEKNGDKSLTLDEVMRRSEVAAIGIDGGGLDDLLGMQVVGRCRETGQWLSWVHAWAYPIVFERRKEIAEQLRDFQADGDLTIVERPDQDVEEVAKIVERVEKAGLLAMVGVDPHGIGAIYDALVGTEAKPGPIVKEKIKGISQGWKLVGPIHTAERKLFAGMLRHGATRLMQFSCGNARVVPAGNAELITKQASGSAKIDPLMALFDAVEIMALNPAPVNREAQLFFV